ncbi:MAG: alpha/beta hydrolase [Halanaerobiales bacterium]|nr:alpha/beta hydrolase [Halanaerobiales bacterium]
MKILGILKYIVLFVGGLLLVFIVFSTINHTYQLKSEAKKYSPPGNLVQVNNKGIHVYSEGQGEITFVFMAGHGTSCPTLDFKPLWKKMTDEYKIVVVEKAGYGWSETSSSPRDIDTMLEETKKALELSGENGPYVLIPHSMSGLEAIYWAQKYPDEVKAIIGLDPGVPDIYEQSFDLLSQKIKLNVMHYILRIGLSRFMGREEVEKNLPLINSKELTREDKEKMIAIFHKSSITKNMLNEVDYIKENAEKISANGVPVNIPMYFFISDGSDVTIPNWKEQLSEYVTRINIGQFKYLDSSHYVHHEKAEIIANETKAFLKEISMN